MNQTKLITKVLLVGLSIFFLIDLIYIHYRLYSLTPLNKSKKEVESSENVDSKLRIQESFSNSTDFDLIDQTIKTATQSLTTRMETLENLPVLDLTASPLASSVQTVVKEYYIPLGTGSTNSTEWVDIAGVEAYVAPSNYLGISEIYFEAGIRVPTGNGRVFARLKNVTDGVSLFESEVSREGSNGGLVSSGKIPVPSQTKLYRVQLKSSLGSTAVLDNGRIKIFVP